MKALNLIIALLLCTQAYGQDFDLKDLLAINSEETFKKFCTENGYAKAHKDERILTYTYEFLDVVGGDRVINYAHWSPEEKFWSLRFVKRHNKRPHQTFEKIFAQAKNECEYSGFSYIDEITYSCPHSENSSMIGFRQLEDGLRDEITFLTPELVKAKN